MFVIFSSTIISSVKILDLPSSAFFLNTYIYTYCYSCYLRFFKNICIIRIGHFRTLKQLYAVFIAIIYLFSYIGYTLGIHINSVLCCAFAVNEKPSSFSLFAITEDLLLSDDIHDYHFVSQGKTEIPGVDDGEEMQLTDVSTRKST